MKGDQHRSQFHLDGAIAHPSEDFLVPAMDAVEGADRYQRRLPFSYGKLR
jgi:hypothetical protein